MIYVCPIKNHYWWVLIWHKQEKMGKRQMHGCQQWRKRGFLVTLWLFTCWCTWKSSTWPKSFDPCTHVGSQDEVIVSWFWPIPVLAVVKIWGVNQQIKDFLPVNPRCLTWLPLSVCKSAFLKLINKWKKKKPVFRLLFVFKFPDISDLLLFLFTNIRTL